MDILFALPDQEWVLSSMVMWTHRMRSEEGKRLQLSVLVDEMMLAPNSGWRTAHVPLERYETS